MPESKSNPHIIAAVIGAIAVIMAAIIGVAFQNKREDNARLAKTLVQKDEDIATQSTELKKRDAAIQDLAAKLSQQQALVEGLQRQLNTSDNQAHDTSTAGRISTAPPPTPSSQLAGTNSPPREVTGPEKRFVSRVEVTKPACSQHGGMVKCSFSMTNRAEKGQKVTIEVSNISGTNFYSYLIDANGMKHVPSEYEIGGVPQHIWGGEMLDPDVPVSASLAFESEQILPSPFAVSFTLRIQPIGDPNIGDPQLVSFKGIPGQ